MYDGRFLEPASRIDSRDGECRPRDRAVGTTSQGSRVDDPRSGVTVHVYTDYIAFLLLKNNLLVSSIQTYFWVSCTKLCR